MQAHQTLQIRTPVLIPQYQDCECHIGEKPLQVEQIQKLAKEYQNYGIIDEEHTYLENHKNIGTPTHYEILPETKTITRANGTTYTYPQGTWIQTITIHDPKVIQKIQNGQLTGVSATTVERARIPYLLQKVSTKSIKRILMKDIKDPVTITISLVKAPCVHESLFLEVETIGDDLMTETNNPTIDLEETNGLLSKIVEAVSIKAKPTKEPKEEEPVEYLSVKEFANYKTETDKVIGSLKSEIASLKEELASKEKPEEEDEEKSEPKKEEPKDETVDEASEKECKKEEEAKKERASTKTINHHGEASTKKRLSDTAIIYNILGRDSNGSKITRKQE